jgi:SAM-dependent methyltransferase
VDEIERIKLEYARRKKTGLRAEFYLPTNLANFYINQQKDRRVLQLLKKHNFIPLNNKKVLDIGCGSGGELRTLLRYGAAPENLFGIDLLPERVQEARRLSPNITFTCGNAERLPYPDGTFDLVTLFVVFTSIFGDLVKRNVAGEMLRVMKPDGMILWYDYWTNPLNPHARGVKAKEIKALFPHCRFDFNKATLAAPVVRALVEYSWLLCYLLEKIPLLRTYYMVAIWRS